MAEYLDGLYRSAASTGAMIFVLTTSVVILYLLFNLAPIIETFIQKDNPQESVIVDNREVHINIKGRTYEIHFNKLKSLFWRLVLISYGVGVVLWLSIILVVPLAIIAILWIRKVGVFKGARRVLRIASPK